MTTARLLLLAAVAGVVTVAPGAASAQGAPADPSPHRAGVASVDGVRIEYLDWGGTGTALVFIPGFGNSAHVFDEFAPRFADRHRVVAVTRVGFGGSDQPEQVGYSLDARVDHLRAVLDSLGIRRAVLAGHSLGGDEITAFAARHPDRTAGLVYLDAALDHVQAIGMEGKLAPFFKGAPTPVAADLASAASYRAFLGRMRGVTFPIGEVAAITRFDSAGAVRGPRTSGPVIRAIFAATPPLDYRGVRAPALALYADPRRGSDVLPFLKADSAADAGLTAVLDSVMRPWRARETARIQRELTGARAVTFPSHHYQFLSHPDETERLMREFLRGLRAEGR